MKGAACIYRLPPETRAGIEPAYRPLQGSCLTIRATWSDKRRVRQDLDLQPPA
jgi:hypothetical protein